MCVRVRVIFPSVNLGHHIIYVMFQIWSSCVVTVVVFVSPLLIVFIHLPQLRDKTLPELDEILCMCNCFPANIHENILYAVSPTIQVAAL